MKNIIIAVMAAAVALTVVGCKKETPAEKMKKGAANAWSATTDAAKSAASAVSEKAKEAAEVVGDAAKNAADAVGEKAKEVKKAVAD